MLVQGCQDTATKFKRKWMILHQKEESGGSAKDDSLTSLQWLQGFSIPSANPESLPKSRFHQEHLQDTDSLASPTAATGSPQESGQLASSTLKVSPGDNSSTSKQTETSQSGQPVAVGACSNVDFKTNSKVKPPYSYATLICMAMRGSKKSKLTLSAIYDWITENFCYYRYADLSWQNSIRHNLSLNKCFRKVPRQKNEPGKGGFWEIDPRHADMFVNGIFQRKRTNTHLSFPKHSKTFQSSKECIQTQHGMQFARNPNQRQCSGDQNWAQSSPLQAREMRGPPDGWVSDTCDEERRRQALDDLELSTALHSLSKEMEDFQPGCHVAGHGNWCVTGPEPLVPRFVEVTAVGDGGGCGQGDCQGVYPQHVHGTHLSVTPPPQYYEELTMFSSQQVYSWDCFREDVQAVPVAVDGGVGVCDGFLYEMQSWERMEPYLHV